MAERGGNVRGDREEGGSGGSGGGWRGGGSSPAVDVDGNGPEAELGTLHGFCIGNRVRESLTFYLS